jgi:hypothetical protein
VFVSFYDKLYVYSIKTRTWTTWESTVVGTIGEIFPIPGEQGVEPSAYTYSVDPREAALYKIVDIVDTATEEMDCTVITKNYDYRSPARFKRLFGWKVDCLVKTELDSLVEPISFVAAKTWTDLSAYSWSVLKSWLRPLEDPYQIPDSVITESLISGRKVITFLKSCRFRQVNFKLVGTTNGSSTEAPLRIFNIITAVKDKAKVSAQVS